MLLTSAALSQASRLLHLWHLTSLDAPTVAIVWCLAFAHAAAQPAGIPLPAWLPMILGLSAWAFYITDRLLDAKSNANLHAASGRALAPQPRPLNPVLQPRHHFHWNHRHLFLPLAIFSTLAALALVVHYMPLVAQTRNSVLAVASLAYLASIHIPTRKLKLPKELLVAIVFTAACTFPTLLKTPSPHLSIVPAILSFTALAWLNCQAIESWEARTSPIAPITKAALALACVTLALACSSAFHHQPRLAALMASAALSALLIFVLNLYGKRLNPTTLRTAADLALLTPLVMFLLPNH